jgi:hypothetical protein
MRLCAIFLSAAATAPAFAADPAPMDLSRYLQSGIMQAANADTLFAAINRQSALIDKVQNSGPLLRLGTSDNPLVPEPFWMLTSERNKRFLTSAEFEQKMGRAVGIVTVGILREDGVTLGNQQGLALTLNASPTTTFTSLSAGYALTRDSAILATASTGRTAGFSTTDGLISQVTSVRTTSYSVGFAASRIWNDQDRLALTLSMPSRVTSGSVQLSSALTQNIDAGALNLRPTATERDLELTYSRSFGLDGKQGRLTSGIMWRQNPGHDATAKPDFLIGVRFARGF